MKRPTHWPWEHTWITWPGTAGMIDSCSCGKRRDHDQMVYYAGFPDAEWPIFEGGKHVGFEARRTG